MPVSQRDTEMNQKIRAKFKDERTGKTYPYLRDLMIARGNYPPLQRQSQPLQQPQNRKPINPMKDLPKDDSLN